MVVFGLILLFWVCGRVICWAGIRVMVFGIGLRVVGVLLVGGVRVVFGIGRMMMVIRLLVG